MGVLSLSKLIVLRIGPIFSRNPLAVLNSNTSRGYSWVGDASPDSSSLGASLTSSHHTGQVARAVVEFRDQALASTLARALARALPCKSPCPSRSPSMNPCKSPCPSRSSSMNPCKSPLPNCCKSTYKGPLARL
jgi:hypothetical protein